MLLTLTSIFFCGHLGGVELAACSLAAVVSLLLYYND